MAARTAKTVRCCDEDTTSGPPVYRRASHITCAHEDIRRQASGIRQQATDSRQQARTVTLSAIYALPMSVRSIARAVVALLVIVGARFITAAQTVTPSGLILGRVVEVDSNKPISGVVVTLS